MIEYVFRPFFLLGCVISVAYFTVNIERMNSDSQNVETLWNLTKDLLIFMLLSVVSVGYFGLTFALVSF